MNTSIQKLYDQGKKYRDALTNLRRRERDSTNELVQRFGCAASIVGGSIVAGAVDGKWGHDSDAEHNGIAAIGPVPINIGVGLAAMAIGVSGFLPGSEYLTCFGSSLVGYPIGKTIENRILDKK